MESFLGFLEAVFGVLDGLFDGLFVLEDAAFEEDLLLHELDEEGGGVRFGLEDGGHEDGVGDGDGVGGHVGKGVINIMVNVGEREY